VTRQDGAVKEGRPVAAESEARLALGPLQDGFANAEYRVFIGQSNFFTAPGGMEMRVAVERARDEQHAAVAHLREDVFPGGGIQSERRRKNDQLGIAEAVCLIFSDG